jgi:hypothetical protein
MRSNSVRAVKEQLRLLAAGLAPDDADGTLAAHVAELERRVRRLNQRGGALAHVRLSSDLLTWRTASEATA